MTSEAHNSAPDSDKQQPTTATEAKMDQARQRYSFATPQAQEPRGGSVTPDLVDSAGSSLREPPQTAVVEEEA